MDSPILDEATLTRLRDVQARLGGKEDVLGELLNIFRADSQSYLADLDAALSADDAEGASRAVHTLKGAALGVGASRVAAFCLQMERDALEGAHALVPKLRDHVQAAIEALTKEQA